MKSLAIFVSRVTFALLREKYWIASRSTHCCNSCREGKAPAAETPSLC